MIRRKYTFLFLIFIFISLVRMDYAFIPPKEWRYYQTIKIEKKGLQKISLPIEALDKSRPGLEDIRIYTENGESVSFILDIPEPEIISPSGPLNFDLSSSGNYTEIFLTTGSLEPVRHLILQTPANDFLKRLDIYSSNDNKNWTLIKKGKVIFRENSGAENLEITPGGVSTAYIKLKIDDNNTKPIPFTGVKLIFQSRKIDVVPLKVNVSIGKQEVFGRKSRITLTLPSKNLYLYSLKLDISTLIFSRNITALTREYIEGGIKEKIKGNYTIYRMKDELSSSDENLEVLIDRHINEQELILEFDNEDSPLLEISDVKGFVLPVNLIFQAIDNKPLVLSTGNPKAEKPVYDLRLMGEKIKKAVFYTPSIETIHENPDYQQPEQLAEFSGLAGNIDISGWKNKKTVSISQKVFNKIELDPEVLSECSSDFRDLRLVAGDRQLAYIIEKTNLKKPVLISIKEKEENVTEKSTHWILQLPYQHLPINQITCLINNSLFNRDIVIFEEKEDKSGIKYKDELARTKIIKLPEEKRNIFNFTLNHYPESDTIHIMVYNQDNEPLTIFDFKGYYPISYLIFKSDITSEIFLYYNNPDAYAPQYDIEMVANEFLNAEKGTGILGKAEKLISTSSFDFTITGKNSGKLFWIALLSVVAVLIIIIRKLLPGGKNES